MKNNNNAAIARKKIHSLLIQLLLISSSVIVMIPLLWALSSSFKPLNQIFSYPIRWIPETISFKNYIDGLNAANFYRYFLNSIIVSVTTTVTVLFFSSMTGFALSFYKFPGRNILFAIVIVTMTIPIQVRVISLYLIVKSFNWLNTYYALIVPFFITSMGIVVMKQFIVYIPKGLFESARIDGCNEFMIFISILLPLIKSGLAALTIINFMTMWNDFFWPLVVIDIDQLRTLSLGLAVFQGYYYTEYGQFFAITLLVSMPIIIVFFILQKFFIESMALSGIKG